MTNLPQDIIYDDLMVRATYLNNISFEEKKKFLVRIGDPKKQLSAISDQISRLNLSSDRAKKVIEGLNISSKLRSELLQNINITE